MYSFGHHRNLAKKDAPLRFHRKTVPNACYMQPITYMTLDDNEMEQLRDNATDRQSNNHPTNGGKT